MESYDIDIPELEKQRYESIKKSGKYAELKILVEAENHKSEDGTVNKLPIVTTSLCNCGPEEISCLYITLKATLRLLRNRFPAECFIGEMTMEAEDLTREDFEEE